MHQVAYGAALALHVLTAVAGFGMLGLSGLYGSWGRRLNSTKDLRDLRQFFGSPNRIGRCLWVVPFAGGAALWLSHGLGALGQAWVLAALVCWAGATVIAVVVIWPGERQIRLVLADLAQTRVQEVTDETKAELVARCRPVVRAAAVCDVIFVVALGLMVLKPGQ
ncbi:MAG TPA: hypothetical protein VHT30_01960 [Acidimicrobiales bacterium]|jgi:hypothetical protein|nr:hypothetical protein [Acidimicrobiales bacterium]